jgi:hypothetical protein
MKKTFNIILALLGVAAVTQAQGNSNCKGCGVSPTPLDQYTVLYNGNLHYRISGAVPGSDVQIYNDISGGVLLKTLVADEQGKAQIIVPADQPAALVVNHNQTSERGVHGSGMVAFFGAPLLQLEKFGGRNAGSFVQLDWKMAASQEGLSVSIERRAPGSEATVIYNDKAPKGDFAQYQSVTDQVAGIVNNGSFTYTMKIFNANGQMTFSESQDVLVPQVGWINVTPSVFQDQISVQVSANRLPGTYAVFDLSGKNVRQQGRLTMANQRIPVNLLPGQYLLQVTDSKGNVTSEKIVRQ